MNIGEKLYLKYIKKGNKTLFFDLEKELKKISEKEYEIFVKIALDHNDVYALNTYVDKEIFTNFIKKEKKYIVNSGILKKIIEEKLISDEEISKMVKELAQENFDCFNFELWQNLVDYNYFIDYVIHNNIVELDFYIEKINYSKLKEILFSNPENEISKHIRKKTELMSEIIDSYVNTDYMTYTKLNLLKICNEDSCPVPDEVLLYYHDYKMGNRTNKFTKEEWDSLAPYFELFSENFKYSSTILHAQKVYPNYQINSSRFSSAYLYANGKALENEEIFNEVFRMLQASIVKIDNLPNCSQITFNMNEEVLLMEMLNDKFAIEKILNLFPEIILTAKCPIDEKITLNCLEKINEPLINTLNYRLNVNSNHMSQLPIFSNEIAMKYLIEINPQYFNFALEPVSQNLELYDLAIKKGFVLNPLVATEAVTKSSYTIERFMEQYLDKKDTIKIIGDKIGISNILYLKNELLLNDEVIKIFGIENICKIIKYIEVPNLCSNMKELFTQYGFETIYYLYDYLNKVNFPKNSEDFDVKLFSNLLNKLTKYNEILKDINVIEYLQKYPIAMYKLLTCDNFKVESIKDIENYHFIMGNKLNETIKCQDTFGETETLLNILETDVYKIEEFYNKFSTVNSKAEQMEMNSSTAFKFIADSLEKRNIRNIQLNNQREYYISIARKLDENLRVLNSILFGKAGSISQYILELLQNNDPKLVPLISAILNFEKKAKELYSYDYESSFTPIEDITKTAEKNGVIIRELLGEQYCLPLHTRDFAQKSNVNINNEKEIGKTYICWTLSSDLHCGHARGNAYTYIYSDIMDKELIHAAPFDLYSTGASDNSIDITTEYQSRFLPTKYMSMYCLQMFNELVSLRGTKPTALFVAEKDQITDELIEEAKQSTTTKTIVVKNENLYYKQHLEKLQNLKEKINNVPTGKDIEEFLYLGTSYMMAYGPEKKCTNNGDTYIFCGSNEFNVYHMISIFKNIIDSIGNKQIIEGEDKKIIEIISMFIRNSYAQLTKDEQIRLYSEFGPRILVTNLKEILSKHETLKYVGQFLDSYVELEPDINLEDITLK